MSMPTDDETDEGFTAKDLVIDVLYAVAISINMYLIVDQVTDGALSRSLSMKWYHTKGKLSDWLDEKKSLRAETGRVIWQAMTIVEGEE